MKKVVHIGPLDNKGGMSSVMKRMISKPPPGWESDVISTSCDSNMIFKIKIWIQSYFHFRHKIKNCNIDLAHIHVTHSLSWWRKITFLRLCKNNDLPAILHIHSGRFDDFCKKFFTIPGKSVKKNLNDQLIRTVVLENRWKIKLKKWIPENSIVIRNSSTHRINRLKKVNNNKNNQILLILFARDSRGKGHDFAIKVFESLDQMGVNVKLIMTGRDNKKIKNNYNGKIQALGWISNSEKDSLMSIADFLIMPSEFEGSSISVIDSIVNGLPCIVSPASSETVGILDLCISIDDPNEWAKRIIYLSDNNKYNDISQKLKVLSDKYLNENISLEWELLYNQMAI